MESTKTFYGKILTLVRREFLSVYHTLAAGHLPVERGCVLTHDDVIRRCVIQDVLCHFHVDFPAFERETGIPFEQYFRAEESDLLALAESGFVRREPDGLSVTPLGRHF